MARPAKKKADISPINNIAVGANLVKKDTGDKYAIYKKLMEYLFKPTPELLIELCKDKKEAEKLKYKVVTYFLTIPKICWYINKRMNHLYDFRKLSPEIWFSTFAQIIQLYGLQDTKLLYFSKYKFSEFGNFYKTITEYYKLGEGISPSSSEINSLFILYKSGNIQEDILVNMKNIIDGKDAKPTKKSEIAPILTLNNQNQNFSTKQKTYNDLHPKIKEMVESCKNYIKGHKNCYSCDTRSNTPIILDTNLENMGPVDIMFLGTSSSKDDIVNGLPFSGSNGQTFRLYFDKLYDHFKFKYVILNTLLCPVINEASVKNIKKNIQNCQEIVNIIRQQFPSKLVVVIGDKAMASVGVKGSITKNHGKIVDGYFIMTNPNSIQYSQANKEKVEEDFSNLYNILQSPNKSLNSNTVETVQKGTYRISEDQIITHLGRNDTLFDIKILNEQIVYFIKDINGKKKYLFENISIPIHVKTGEYANCEFISNNIEYTVNLTSEQKESLARKLRHNMNQLTGQNSKWDKNVDINP